MVVWATCDRTRQLQRVERLIAQVFITQNTQEFFTSGLATQMQETVDRGRQVIKLDLLSQEQGFNERQRAALCHLTSHHSLTIRKLQQLCPAVSKRTLQRDLQGLESLGVVCRAGETNQLNYRLAIDL